MSTLGPLLFDIYICNVLFQDCDIASYAEDSSPYASRRNLGAVINNKQLFPMVSNNHMKVHADKCHLLITGNYETSANINKCETLSSKKEELLGISIYTRPSFVELITSLCKKVSQKLHAFARITHYTDFEKRRFLRKRFLISQFNYCPLIWMSHTRALNIRINRSLS